MIGVAVLGATGSIGSSTLDVLAQHPQRYRAVALTAHSNLERLLQQCLAHRPAYAVLHEPASAAVLRARLKAAGVSTEVYAGADALQEVVQLPEVDQVMAAIVGAAGLLPARAAARAGKRVLLANKEVLVMAGALFMQEAQRSGAELLPVDSEHSAVFQCLPPHFAPGLEAVGVERIVLTASGGPFRETPAESLHAVTPEQACAHPNWSMGRKISVDSATMMNKGLEIIEACCLFGLSPDRVEVLLHPQSIVHAMVQYNDGSVLAQMGNPDMRTPIAHALAWPQRLHSGVGPLELARAGRLDFAAVDPARFPCLDLAYQALRAGGTSTAILNAANEVAVQAFLDRRIRFTDIPRVIEETLGVVPRTDASSLDQILADDSAARVVAAQRAALRTAVAPC